MKGLHGGDKMQPRNYHVLRAFLHYRLRASPKGWTAHSDLHVECYRVLMRLSTGPYAAVRKAAQGVTLHLLLSSPYAVQRGVVAERVAGLTTAKATPRPTYHRH